MRNSLFHFKYYFIPHQAKLLQILLVGVLLTFPFTGIAQSAFNSQESLQALRECVNYDDSCPELLDKLLQNASQQLEADAYTNFVLKTIDVYINVSDFERSKLLIKTIYDDALAAENEEIVERCKNKYALIYFYEGKVDTAIFIVSKLNEQHVKSGDSLKIGRGKLFQGQLVREKALYSDALELYLEALAIFRAISDTLYQANVLSEMATLYAMSDDNKKAIAYGKKAATMFKAIGNEHRYAYVSLNLANNLNYDEKPDSAILILNEVIPIFKADKDIYLEINALAQLSRAHYQKNEISKALVIMEQSNALDPNTKYVGQSIYNFQLMGRMYKDLKAYPSALRYFKKSYKLHQTLGFNDELKPLLLDLANTYETANQSDSALKYFKEYQVVSDSLYSIEEKNRLNELKTQYEADLKEEQLRNNASEIELLEQSNQAKTQRNINLGIILVVVIALTIAIISRQRNSIKLNKLISAQKEIAHEAELAAKESEREKLEEDLKHRQRELANQALLIAEKNELLRSFRSEVERVGDKEEKAKGSLLSISRKMERAENQQGDWDKFMQLFKDVHPNLWSKLAQASDDLTQNDLRLLALMKMGFSNKEIADILHITEGGLKKARYRLRKKLNLEAQANLHQYIQNM